MTIKKHTQLIDFKYFIFLLNFKKKKLVKTGQ